MGIRESLEQSEKNGELNLKNFVMPEDEKEEGGFDFDVEKEITEEDWQEIKRHFNESMEMRASFDCLGILSDELVVASERKNELISEAGEQKLVKDVIESNEGFSDLLTIFELDSDNINLNFIDFALSLGRVFRLPVTDIKLGWQGCYSVIEHFYLVYESIFPAVNIINLLKSIAVLRLLFAEEMKDDSLLNKIADTCLEKMRKKASSHFDVELMAVYKIAFSEKARFLKFDWESVIKTINGLRYEKNPPLWSCFLRGKACMKILSAKEAKLTDNGIELIMPEKSLKRDNLKRPERRTY